MMVSRGRAQAHIPAWGARCPATLPGGWMGFTGFCLGVGLRELGGVVGCGLVLGQEGQREGELGRVVGWF